MEEFKIREAYHKIDNTVLLNFNRNSLLFEPGGLQFGIDEEGHIDCNDLDEAIDSLNILDTASRFTEIVINKEVNVRFLKQMLQNEGWVRYETYQDYLRKDCEEFKRAYLSVSLLPLTQEEFDIIVDVIHLMEGNK